MQRKQLAILKQNWCIAHCKSHIVFEGQKVKYLNENLSFERIREFSTPGKK